MNAPTPAEYVAMHPCDANRAAAREIAAYAVDQDQARHAYPASTWRRHTARRMREGTDDAADRNYAAACLDDALRAVRTGNLNPQH